MKSLNSKGFTRSNEYVGFVVMLLSFLCALSLNILPLPLWMKALWPLWTVLILIFWTAYFSDVLNPWLVWMVGLFEDVLQGSFLGEHALALLLAYFLARGMSRQIKTFSLASQMGKIAIILLGYQGTLFVLQGFYLHTFNDVLLWLLPLITTLLLWPWILYFLHSIAVRFYIHRM
jgi:rod shape-determining protein MreD